MPRTSQDTSSRVTSHLFVSSTRLDLIPYRDQVRETLGRLRQLAVVMEQFGAEDGDATEVSTDKVASADLYLGIFAWRYGYIPPRRKRSVTHLEYLHAKRLGKPRFLFLADPTTQALNGPGDLFPETLRDPDRQKQLLAFRARLERERVVDYFTTPENLASKVATVLGNYLREQDREQALKGPRPPRNRPGHTRDFVGRTQEMHQLCLMLSQGHHMALVAAVTGMAGVGKSVLAFETMRALADDPAAFPGGMTWMRCDGRTNLAGLVWVYEQLAAAWNLPIAPEELGRAAAPEAADLYERALKTSLRPPDGTEQRPLALVLLDNVERDFPLKRALDTLGTLNMAVLMTSRIEPSAENLQLLRLEVLDAPTALALFAEHFRSRGGIWEPDRDSPAATKVVAALGYLPLAVTLAAARAARMHGAGVAVLAAEVQQPRILARLQDSLDKTASVRYSFKKSLALLTPGQRSRFAALGLPDGPDWPRSIVEHLLIAVPPASTEASSAEADLDEFAGLSLVTLMATETFAPNRPETRVRLHPLLRELAREEWASQPVEMHRLALAALLKGVSELVKEHQHDFPTLAREEELITGTLRHASQEGVQPEQFSMVTTTLFDYLDVGGHWQLGMELLTLQRDAQRELGDHHAEGRTLEHLGRLANSLGRKEEAIHHLEQALVIWRDVGNRAGEATALNTLGHVAKALGRLDQAKRCYEQALAIRQDLGDRRGVGVALNGLGNVFRLLGQLAEAQHYYEQSLAIDRELGDRLNEGRGLHNLGLVVSNRGHLEEAKRYYEQALTIEHEEGDRAMEGITLNSLGGMAKDLGQREEGRHYLLQALAIRREISDRLGEGTTLNNLGELSADLEQREEARYHYEQALAIAREVGDREGEARTLDNLGILVAELGQVEEAKRYHDHALTIRREVDRAGEGITLNNLGRLFADLGQMEQARSYFDHALAIGHEVGDQWSEAGTLTRMGILLAALGHLEDARRCYEQALTIRRRVNDRVGEGYTLFHLGRLAGTQGNLEEKVSYCEQALSIRRDVGDRVGERYTLSTLERMAGVLENPQCPVCLEQQLVIKAGRTRSGSQRYWCRRCRKSFTLKPKGRGYTARHK